MLSRLPIVVALVWGCPEHTVSRATKNLACPPTPADFRITVRREIGDGRISIGLRASRWSIAGGDYGDIRSDGGDFTAEDQTLLSDTYCDLWRIKVMTPEGARRCSGNESSLTIHPGRGFRTDDGSTIIQVADCDPIVEEVADRLVDRLALRLPPPSMPHISSYRHDIPTGCRANPLFKMILYHGAGLTVDGTGEFTGRTVHGRLPETTIDRLACELTRYDFEVLQINRAGRRVYCPERVSFSYMSGIGSYSGLAIDVRIDGEWTQLQIGNCPYPLDLYDVIRSVREKASFLYIIR